MLVFHWRNLFFVSYHEIGAHRWLFFAPYSLTAGGHEAVMIFFVLSGYLIGGSVYRSMASNQWSWASYLTHRLVRLWVVLVPGLLLCLLWDMLLYWGIDSTHSFHFSDPALPKTLRELNTDSAAAFFGTLFFLQNVVVPAFGSDAALWSLANEFWYYILFPLGMLSILSSTRLRTRILTAGLFLLLCLWLGKSLLVLFPVWLMGAAVLVLPRARLNNSIRWLALAGYVPTIFLCTYLKGRLHLGSDFIIGGATAALIWTMLSATQPASRSSLVPRLCRGFARFSYTLYVVHAPFLLLFASLLVGTALWQPTWPEIGIGLGILALTIGYAYGVAALTEFHTDSVRAWVERHLGLEVHRTRRTQGASVRAMLAAASRSAGFVEEQIMSESVLSRLSASGRVPEDIRHAAAQQRRFDTENTEHSVAYLMLDCSGTTMDRYVDAPAIVFVEVFKQYGLEITMPEARGPMGLRKDLHIRAITQIPSVRKRFIDKFGREPGQSDVDAMFAVFVPTQLALLRNGAYHTLLPGVGELCKEWQKQGIKIGVTTGFTRQMLDLLLAGAAKQGFVPDTHCAGDEVELPRPTAYMVVKNLERMGVYNLENALRRTIKVDDTVSGAGEGAPLCWRVGVSKWSNYVADSWDAVRKMSAGDLAAREQASKAKLVSESGAHYVIDDLRALPAVIADVNQRLANGERP